MQIEEAIEYLKMRSEKYKSHKEQIDLVTDIYGTENIKEYHKKQEAIDTLLNYIEIMHKELDRLEGIEDNTAMLKKELEESKKATTGMYDDYQDLGKEYYKLQCELEKKDKVINEMAGEMCYGVFKFKNVKQVKEYLYKKVSDNK